MPSSRNAASARLCVLGFVSMLAASPGPLAGWQAEAPGAGPTAGVEDLSFLTGCWAGTMGSLDMREYWTESEAGVMMWTTRFFRDGTLADFEFGMLIEEDGVPVLWPYPRGSRSEHGFPLVRTEPEYVFENLEHDFPVRIVYTRDGPDRLSPRIEGEDGTGPGWSLERIDCPEGVR